MAFNSPWPHSDKLSMCSRRSGQVITPGVESGATKSGQVHLGNAPTSLHISTQTPASLFCSAALCCTSSCKHDFDFLRKKAPEAECTKSKANTQANRDMVSANLCNIKKSSLRYIQQDA